MPKHSPHPPEKRAEIVLAYLRSATPVISVSKPKR